MPWESGAHEAGFTSGTPWLPIPDYHIARAADVQIADENSVLAHARKAVALRKAHPALKLGDMTCFDAEGRVLAFMRESAGERLLCVFNLGKTAAQFTLPDGTGECLFEVGEVKRNGMVVSFGPRSGVILMR